MGFQPGYGALGTAVAPARPASDVNVAVTSSSAGDTELRELQVISMLPAVVLITPKFVDVSTRP